MCKYSSRYKTAWSHAYYNSKQIGQALANLLLPIFNPVLTPEPLNDDDNIVHFTNAKIVSAILPGGLYYLSYDKPRLPVQTLDYRKKSAQYGRDCTSSKENEYFRINVDPHSIIMALTFIGPRRPPVENLICLYGMNERMLNRFVARFDEGISDMLSFFSQEWALCLYHDRFSAFLEKLQGEMNRNPEMQVLINKMNKLSSNGAELVR